MPTTSSPSTIGRCRKPPWIIRTAACLIGSSGSMVSGSRVIQSLTTVSSVSRRPRHAHVALGEDAHRAGRPRAPAPRPRPAPPSAAPLAQRQAGLDGRRLRDMCGPGVRDARTLRQDSGAPQPGSTDPDGVSSPDCLRHAPPARSRGCTLAPLAGGAWLGLRRGNARQSRWIQAHAGRPKDRALQRERVQPALRVLGEGAQRGHGAGRAARPRPPRPPRSEELAPGDRCSGRRTRSARSARGWRDRARHRRSRRSFRRRSGTGGRARWRRGRRSRR